VEVVQQDDVREAVEILKSCVEILEHLNSALYAGGARRLNRHAFRHHKWGVDDPDWCKFDLHFLTRSSGYGDLDIKHKSMLLSG